MNEAAKNLLTAGLVLFLFALGCAGPNRHDSSYNSASVEPPLELLSYHGTRGYSYLIVEGQVRNRSTEKLERVMAVVETSDENGQFVTSEDALIEYTPLMPGQTSPFKVMIRDNPAIKRFRVNFKEVFGGVIPYVEAAKPTPTPAQKKSRSK